MKLAVGPTTATYRTFTSRGHSRGRTWKGFPTGFTGSGHPGYFITKNKNPKNPANRKAYVRAAHARDVSPLLETKISLRAPPCRPQ